MIHYLTLEDRWMFPEYLEYWGRELAPEFSVVGYEQLLRDRALAPGTYVFTTFDELPPAMVRYVDALAAHLRTTDSVRILNDPARVLQRFDLHERLWKEGRNRFRSRRATDSLTELRFPVFLRSARSHDGSLSPLLHASNEVEAWIGRLLVLGRRLDHLMVVEFCDTADESGAYRKYAAFNVDGSIVPRSLNYGHNWMLKFAGNDFSMAMAQEELDYVTANPHRKELEKIFQMASIDYGRIDYALLGGEIQTWEINNNPTIGRGLRPSSREIDPQLRDVREKTKETFYAQFNDAWKRVIAASPGKGTSPLAIELDPIVLTEARDEMRKTQIRSGVTGSVLRMTKPLMKTAMRPLLRMLYRLPKRIVHASPGSLFVALSRRVRQR